MFAHAYRVVRCWRSAINTLPSGKGVVVIDDGNVDNGSPCLYTTCVHIHVRTNSSLIFLCLYRDCPGVGTSSGPAGKEVSYHGNVGGSSVGYKPPPQHGSPQTRGPHFPQEPVVGSQANSPPLRINICGQVKMHTRYFFLFFVLFFFSFACCFVGRKINRLDQLVTIFRKTRCVARY